MICQCMIQAFMYGTEWENDFYDMTDLQIGIQYARDLMEFEGLTKEPFHGYDLQQFIYWAEKRCSSLIQRRRS